MLDYPRAIFINALNRCVVAWAAMRRHTAAKQRRNDNFVNGRGATGLFASARLVYAEEPFVIDDPIALSVRVDRAYDDGEHLFLLEFKVRESRRAYPSDVIELSAQRVAVAHATKRPVSTAAYVLIMHPHSGRWDLCAVRLHSEAYVVELAKARRDLFDGTRTPQCAPFTKSCKRCEYAVECEKHFASPSYRSRSQRPANADKESGRL